MVVLSDKKGTTVPIKVHFVGPDDNIRGRKKIPKELLDKAKKRGSKCLVYVVAKPTKGAVIYGHAYCCPQDDPKLSTGIILAYCNLAVAADKMGWKVTA